MNVSQARELLQASLAKPKLVSQVVPSPFTFTWDAIIQQTILDQTLGELIYVEVTCFASCLCLGACACVYAQLVVTTSLSLHLHKIGTG